MKLVVGLGNPGEEYSKTRHNVGYMFLDKYYSDFSLNKKFKAMELNIKVGDENVILIKPITFCAIIRTSKNVVQAGNMSPLPQRKNLR